MLVEFAETGESVGTGSDMRKVSFRFRCDFCNALSEPVTMELHKDYLYNSNLTPSLDSPAGWIRLFAEKVERVAKGSMRAYSAFWGDRQEVHFDTQKCADNWMGLSLEERIQKRIDCLMKIYEEG